VGGIGGIFASYGGASGAGNFATIGAEAFRDFGNWRVYGQAGYTGGVSGDASDANAKDWYGQGVVSYYFNPNLALSGNFGGDHYTESGGYGDTGLTWGVRFEYKLPKLPVSTYVAYQGWHNSDSASYYEEHSTETTFIVGMRVLFGGKTLRDNDQNVGLTDMNQIYGEFFPH
jgi:hypothetical protein